jgi:hypothetical protein
MEDILDSVLDPGPGEGEAEEDSGDTPEAPPAGVPSQGGSGADTGSLQSKLDVAVEENRALQERLAALESVAPLARYVDRNPHVLDHLDAMTQLDVGMAKSEDDQNVAPLPEYPEKPEHFDPAEVSDPHTPSGKYWMKLQEYNAAANQRLLTESSRQKEERTMAAKAQAKARQAREYEAQLNTRLTGEYGLNANEVADFWKFVTDPEQLNEANMVKFYRAARGEGERSSAPVPAKPGSDGPSQPQAEWTPEQLALKRQAERMGLRLSLPEAAVVGAGAESGAEPNEQDLFFGSLTKPESDTGLIF